MLSSVEPGREMVGDVSAGWRGMRHSAVGSAAGMLAASALPILLHPFPHHLTPPPPCLPTGGAGDRVGRGGGGGGFRPAGRCAARGGRRRLGARCTCTACCAAPAARLLPHKPRPRSRTAHPTSILVLTSAHAIPPPLCRRWPTRRVIWWTVPTTVCGWWAGRGFQCSEFAPLEEAWRRLLRRAQGPLSCICARPPAACREPRPPARPPPPPPAAIASEAPGADVSGEGAPVKDLAEGERWVGGAGAGKEVVRMGAG